VNQPIRLTPVEILHPIDGLAEFRQHSVLNRREPGRRNRECDEKSPWHISARKVPDTSLPAPVPLSFETGIAIATRSLISVKFSMAMSAMASVLTLRSVRTLRTLAPSPRRAGQATPPDRCSLRIRNSIPGRRRERSHEPHPREAALFLPHATGEHLTVTIAPVGFAK
jgi:hypothetical protein